MLPPVLQLLGRLAREAGWRHLGGLALLSSLSSLLDVFGLGLGVALLLSAEPAGGLQLPLRFSLQQGLALLALLVATRGVLQTLVAIGSEQLRSGFHDRLRSQLLALVLQAPTTCLEQVGRGELLGLLLGDISRSVYALGQAIGILKALLSLSLYLSGVLVVGSTAAMPLVLALVATGAAAWLQRSGSWRLGRLQTRLNIATQRTVSDGLNALKGLRAASAEAWILRRFNHHNRRSRNVLRGSTRRQSLFNALRDTLVVLVVGMWLIWGRSDLQPAAIATTLLLAYRSATALSSVIHTRRSCLEALRGYEELCRKRAVLAPSAAQLQGVSIEPASCAGLRNPSVWRSLRWSASDASLQLHAGALLVVVGPSGSGKTTLLDRFCGLLGEERSCWVIESTDGVVTLAGAAGARQLRQLLAYAPQDAEMLEASLRTNLLLGRQQPRALISHWLARLGLDHLLRRSGGLDDPLPLALDQFSGGELHRLGLLRAWLRDCAVEVLDEPTAFLDAESAARVRSILLERSRERLVLVSSHDPDLIALADQVVHLDAMDRQTAERQHHGGAPR